MPGVWQERCHRRFTHKEYLPTCQVMGKIRETDDELSAHSQGFFQHDVRFFHLLKALIEHHIIKRLI